MRQLARGTVALVVTCAARAAWAAPPSLDEVANAAMVVSTDAQYRDNLHAPALSDDVAVPFWYEGFDYTAAAGFAQRVRLCRARLGHRGVITDPAQRRLVFECLGYVAMTGLRDITDASTWRLVDLDALPRPFVRYRARLAELARDHTLALAQATTADDRIVAMWIAARDELDAPVLDGLLLGVTPAR